MKILANDGISPSGIAPLEAAGFEVQTTKVAQEQLIDYINTEGISVLLVRSATKARKDLIDACPDLKMIGRGGVGMDNIDVEYAKSKGVEVINTPAASSDSVAELVFSHLFGMLRFLYTSNREMPLEGDSRFKELKKAYSKGRELQGKTLGIIGFGRIGQAVAKRAFGLGMKVVAADANSFELPIELSFPNGANVSIPVATTSLEEVLSSADFVTIHVPGGGREALIGERELALMKQGSCLINAARGGVVDEKALLAALDSGQLAHAALDVFENEPDPEVKLLMHPQISLSPHIGAATLEAQERIGEELAAQIISSLG